jgi:hypothetical protein
MKPSDIRTRSMFVVTHGHAPPYLAMIGLSMIQQAIPERQTLAATAVMNFLAQEEALATDH